MKVTSHASATYPFAKIAESELQKINNPWLRANIYERQGDIEKGVPGLTWCVVDTNLPGEAAPHFSLTIFFEWGRTKEDPLAVWFSPSPDGRMLSVNTKKKGCFIATSTCEHEHFEKFEELIVSVFRQAFKGARVHEIWAAWRKKAILDFLTMAEQQ